MKEIKLRMNEQRKYDVIKEVVNHGLSKERASLKLGLSIRQINRLIKIYKEKGKSRLCAWESFKKTSKMLR